MTTQTLNVSDYEITNGYIGSMGTHYEKATSETFAVALAAAVAHYATTEEKILLALAGGQALNTVQSPNYYYDHSYGKLRLIEWRAVRAAACKPVTMVACSCGHTIPSHLVMAASLGTSCDKCYDRLSN